LATPLSTGQVQQRMDIYDVDVALLRTFSALVSERNVSKTAERLNVSQPAVSHALDRLRKLFDDPLLVRAQGRMTPTVRALELAGEVNRILSDLEHLTAAKASFNPASTRAKFVLSATEYLEYLLVPTLLARLEEEAPGVDLEIRSPSPSRSLSFSALEQGDLDLQLAWMPSPLPSQRFRRLFSDRLVCIARRDHPQVQGSLSFEQLLSLPHVRGSRGSHVTGRSIDSAVAARGGRLRLALKVENFLTIPFVVARSDAIAALPEGLARDFAGPLKLQVLEPPLKLPQVRFAMYWHERTHNNRRHQWFRKLLAEVAETVWEGRRRGQE
jgi:DNA-binding transcriptional LysR family regulator